VGATSPSGGRRCTAPRRGRGSAGSYLRRCASKGTSAASSGPRRPSAGPGLSWSGPGSIPSTPPSSAPRWGAVPADVHPDEQRQPSELAPPPSLPRHRSLARRVGRAPPLRLSPPDDPRPRRGAPGAHPLPARPLLGPHPHPYGRRGRLPESRRGGEPVPLRGISGQVGPRSARRVTPKREAR